MYKFILVVCIVGIKVHLNLSTELIFMVQFLVYRQFYFFLNILIKCIYMQDNVFGMVEV